MECRRGVAVVSNFEEIQQTGHVARSRHRDEEFKVDLVGQLSSASLRASCDRRGQLQVWKEEHCSRRFDCRESAFSRSPPKLRRSLCVQRCANPPGRDFPCCSRSRRCTPLSSPRSHSTKISWAPSRRAGQPASEAHLRKSGSLPLVPVAPNCHPANLVRLRLALPRGPLYSFPI